MLANDNSSALRWHVCVIDVGCPFCPLTLMDLMSFHQLIKVVGRKLLMGKLRERFLLISFDIYLGL